MSRTIGHTLVACTVVLVALHAADVQSSRITNQPVILRAFGVKPDKTIAVALLNQLGKNGTLEEPFAQRGLSLRPWDGKTFQDYTWVYVPGTTFSFRLQVPAAKDCTRAVISLWDWSGQIIYARTYTALPVDDFLTLKAECHGVWLVTLDLYGDARGTSLKSRLVKSFGTPVDATAARATWRGKNDYLIGSCFFPRRYYRWGKQWRFDNPPLPELAPAEGIDRLAGLAARAGITVLRIDDFSRLGKAASKPDWDLQAEVIDILRRHSIQADLKVHLLPDCFVGRSLERNGPVFAVWEADLDYIIEHLLRPADTNVAMVELGNEPAHHEFWSGTREQYQRLFHYAQKKIHAASPAVPVVHGASCPPGADLSGEKLKDHVAYAEKKKRQEDWYDGFYRDMARQGNLWAYHQHGKLNVDAFAWREWERAKLSADGFRGNYLQTEGGDCAWRPDFEATAWITVMQKILYSWSCGEKGWLQFDLAFNTTTSRYRDIQGWSLLQASDLEPKFQYAALAAMTQTMAGCTLERTLYLDKVAAVPSLAVLFHHPKGKMIAWFGAPGKDDLRVRSDARTVTFFDPMGNAGEMHPSGNATLLWAPYPQYILLSGATHAEIVK